MLTRSSLVRAAVTALTLAAGLTAGPARAQPGDRPWLFLSYNSEEPADRDPVGAIWDKDRHRVLLRPNVAEPLYLYVRNPTDKADYDLTVVLANGPDAADEFGRTANVRVGARQTVRVRPPKPAPVAGLPARAAPPPPMNTPLPRGLYLHLLVGAESLSVVPLPVRVQEPSQYVAPEATFQDRDGQPRRLVVTLRDRLRDNRPFTGPPARVSLDVSPARVPELIPESVRGSTLLGVLPPGGQATLVAANLRFRGPNHSGVVAVGVDGYERAFLFQTDFSGTAPQPVNAPMLRLAGPRYAVPGKPCPIRLEVDNPPTPDVVVEFGVDRANTAEFVTTPHPGERFQRAEARWDAAAGGLVVASVVHDWIQELDTAGMTGPRKLRLRLLDRAGKVLVRPQDNSELVVTDTIVFDDTPPEGVQIGPIGPAIRNRLLDVSAVGFDPESGIAGALFFLGEPPAADGKPAPGGRVAVAVPPIGPEAPYTGQFLMPERAGRVQIGVRFVNNAGLVKDVTTEIEVTEPPPKPTTGAIKVTVVQGTTPLPQAGVAVQLRDDKNATILKTATANDKGECTFEGLAPGSYIVYSSRPSAYTKGQKAATVEVGKTAEVTLELKR